MGSSCACEASFFAVPAGLSGEAQPPGQKSNNRGGTLTLTDRTFSENQCGGPGGGLYNGEGALTLTNFSFTGNSASRDAGLCCPGGTLTMSNCTLMENSAQDGGGGILLAGEIFATISNFTITNNIAEREAEWCGGGGIHISAMDASSFLTILSCSIAGSRGHCVSICCSFVSLGQSRQCGAQ